MTSPTETPSDDTLRLRDNPQERGTRHLFGKPYHYGSRIRDGKPQLVLLPGPDPRTTDFDDLLTQAGLS